MTRVKGSKAELKAGSATKTPPKKRGRKAVQVGEKATQPIRITQRLKDSLEEQSPGTPLHKLIESNYNAALYLQQLTRGADEAERLIKIQSFLANLIGKAKKEKEAGGGIVDALINHLIDLGNLGSLSTITREDLEGFCKDNINYRQS